MKIVSKKFFNIGAMPFAQLYKDKNGKPNYSKEWKDFARIWSRPAIYKTLMKRRINNTPEPLFV
jgi:hypothetical protein